MTNPFICSDENINTIKTIKTIEAIKTNKTIGLFISNEMTSTNDPSSARPAGDHSLEDSSCQKALGVVAAPKTLAQERQELVDSNQWITQSSVGYVKVSIWPVLDKDARWTSYQCQYGLKLDNTDLRLNQFTCKLTNRHNDYLGYAREKWPDANGWKYPEIAAIVKEGNQSIPGSAYAGRCSRNVGRRKGLTKMPNLAFTSTLLIYEAEEDEWACYLWHHGFFKRMSIPQYEWNHCQSEWMKTHSITKEFHKKSPPMIAFEWRNLA